MTSLNSLMPHITTIASTQTTTTPQSTTSNRLLQAHTITSNKQKLHSLSIGT